MSEEEKGYKCPDEEDCTQCKYYKDLCIVYGSTGKKKYKKWLENQQKMSKR